MAPASYNHFVIFPFMAQGHTLPLLYFSRLLRQRSIAVTIFTTAKNSASIQATLQDTDISVLELPFPQQIDDVPPGVENTDKLPSVENFLVPFARATKLMQQDFEQAINKLQPVSCIVSDAFLGWTQQSAAKFGIPRLFFFGMSNFAMTMYPLLGIQRPHAGTASQDTPFVFRDFPNLKLTRNDFDPPFADLEPAGPMVDFMAEQSLAMAKSQGVIVNSFYELEARYIDYRDQNIGPKSWNVGPLCLAKPPASEALESPPHMQWLDEKLAKGEPVLYVAFGTQADISTEQLNEIAEGLEKSQVSFCWVLRKGPESLQVFEDKMENRGIIVKEWVDQMEILHHDAVKGFLSHCGWNSLLESVCAKVPILALPMMAEQHLNARLITEEAGIGLRIMPYNGSVRGFVKAEAVEKPVKELMEGEKGKAVKRKVAEVGEVACGAMKEGGSSWHTLNLLVHNMCGKGL